MKPYISMITLGVKDLKKSIEFYEKGLGLPRMPFDGEIAFFELNGTWLTLFPNDELAKDAEVPAEGSGFRGVTLSHNLNSKEEVDKQLIEAEKIGATIIKPAQDVYWGGYSGYFADPDGHLWEVAWAPDFHVGPEEK